MPRPMGKRWLAGALCVAAALLSACEANAPQDYLNFPEGPYAKQADRLWDLTFWIAAVIFFLVEGLLVYALVKFRHRPGRRARQFHGNTKLEVILTVIPALILAGIAIPTLSTIFSVSAEPANPLRIKVIGHQFWWEYHYEGSGVVTANELHIPINQPVRLEIQGADNDVIHSFWVPRLAGKQDVVPGHTNFINIEATREDVYLGQCTEFCGLSHANMRLTVVAESPQEFATWLADQQDPAAEPTDPLAQEGQKLFLEGECIGCHTIEGTDAAALVGPNLTHFASRDTFAAGMFERTDENLRRWLDDPPGVKPGALMILQRDLPPDEIDALVAYLQSLE